MVREFARRGVQAAPGFAVTGGSPDLSREEMERRVAARAADGALICKMIAIGSNNAYLPPPTYTVTKTRYPAWWSDPYWGYYHPYPHHYWGHWQTATQVVWTQGYWSRSVAYRIESSLYQASDNKLVWTATSNTYDPQTEADLAASLAKEILRALRSEGFLAGQ